MKPVYSLKPLENNKALVLGPDDIPIATHEGKKYPPLNKDIAQILADDLYSIYERNFENSKDIEDEDDYLMEWISAEILGNEWRESFVYCVLSNFIENPDDHVDDINLEALQWDRVFRLSPGPPRVLIEMRALEPLKKALKSEWVNLPLNYAQSLEEMEEDENAEFVPDEIVNEAQELLNGLNRYQKFAILLLGDYYHNFSLIIVLFFVNHRIDAIEFLNLYYAFGLGEEYSELNEDEQRDYNYQLKRLDFFMEYLSIIKF